MVNLHPVMKRRIKALKKIQKNYYEIESKFYEEVHALECKYASQYDPLYEKRKDIIIGSIEPTDSDCEWESDDDDGDDDDVLAKYLKSDLGDGGEDSRIYLVGDKNTKGVPGFWLRIFR
jgi:nucleosome assembly protein 1-like 1